MFQVISRTIPQRILSKAPSTHILRCLQTSSVVNSVSAMKLPDATDYESAIPYDKMPGPNALPLISIAHHFMPGGKYHNLGMKECHQKLKEEYGDVVKLKGVFGKPDFIFVFNPKDVELIFRSEGQWPYRMPLEVLDHFRAKERPDLFQGIGGLLQDQGAIWQDTRTKVNPVMMQPKTVKSYVPTVQTIADEFVQRIRSLRDENSEMPADFSNEANKWALESIAYIALDQRLNLMTDMDPNSDGQQMIQAVHDFFELSYQLDILPSVWKYYKTKQFRKAMATIHTMTNLATKLIDKSIEEMKERPQDDAREQSVLEKLLKIDRRVAIIMALDMLMAGVDTTSTAVLGILYQLAKNPEKQEILRREIIEKLPNKDSPLTSELMTNMPYLRAVIKESLRLRPVAMGTARRCNKDLVLSGYLVPKGKDMMMSQMISAMDEEYFKKGNEFLPERYLKKSSSENAELQGQNPFAFLPFGFGSRMCIGKRFADLEMEVVVSKIVRNYRVEWHHEDMKYVSKMLYMPSGDLKFRFVDL